jgi:hypothetical protein
MDRKFVDDILTGNSKELKELKAKLPLLEDFIQFARELDELPDISKRFYEDSRSLFQATSSNRSMFELEKLLSRFFGPPAKPSGKPLPRKLRKNPVVKSLGGVETDQSLFLLPLKTGAFYGALWPWQRKKGHIEIHLGYCSDLMMDEDYQQLETLVKRSLSHTAFQRMDTGVGGLIRGIGLSSFLQMAEMEQASFTLCISSGARTGHLHVKEGQLIDAETNDMAGRDAAFRIISWEDATIEIAPADPARQNRIKLPMMHILMESLKIKDETHRTEDMPPAPPPKAAPPKPKSGAQDRSKRLVRLERASAPQVSKRSRFTTFFMMLSGIVLVAGCGLAIGWYVVNSGAFASDPYGQVRAKVGRTEILEQKIELLQSFLSGNPETEHAQEIRLQIVQFQTRLEENDFERMILQISSLPVDIAYEQEAVSLYGGFVEKYPQSRFYQRISTAVRDTRQLVDRYYYEDPARAARFDFGHRLKIYRQYLALLSHDRHRSELETLILSMGRRHLEFLNSESVSCEQQQRWDACLANYESFIAQVDDSVLIQEAESLRKAFQDKRDLALLRELEAASGNDYYKVYQAYREYLIRNPHSTQLAAIEKEIARLDTHVQLQRQWMAVRTQALDRQIGLPERVHLLDRYLRQHQSGPYAPDAQALMSHLELERLSANRQSHEEARRQAESLRLQREAEQKAQQQLKAQAMRRELEQQLSGSKRYQVNADGTFNDRTSGLTWSLLDSQQELGVCLTYPDSRQYLQSLSSRTRGPWRLPTAGELAGIYKQVPFFPGSDAEWYWTSEAYVRGHHSVVDVVTAKPETVFQREHRRQDQCGAVRAVLAK